MQIKTSVHYHYTFSNMTKMKRQKISKLVSRLNKCTYILPVEMSIGKIIILNFFLAVSICLLYHPAILLQVHTCAKKQGWGMFRVILFITAPSRYVNG